jgi:hypothetical protein
MNTNHFDESLLIGGWLIQDRRHVRLSITDVIRVRMMYRMATLPREVRNYACICVIMYVMKNNSDIKASVRLGVDLGGKSGKHTPHMFVECGCQKRLRDRTHAPSPTYLLLLCLS